MQEYGFSVTRILPYKDKNVDVVLIRENTGHWKPVFSHSLCSARQFQFLRINLFEITFTYTTSIYCFEIINEPKCVSKFPCSVELFFLFIEHEIPSLMYIHTAMPLSLLKGRLWTIKPGHKLTINVARGLKFHIISSVKN